jgi:perosamine synthetase
VIVVDLYGNMPDLDPILELCNGRNIAVIEDAAEAVGATYKRRPAGPFGMFSAFSFHGSKTLTTGEGGILLLDDESVYQRCLALRDHGRSPGDVMYWSHTIGQKYRMSSMQAALGMARLERLPEHVDRKRAIFDWYRRELADVSGVALNSEAIDVFNTYWMVTVVLDPKLGLTKEKVILALREHDIDCWPFFHPLSMLPPYHSSPTAAAARKRNSASYALSPYGVNLPSALSLTEDDVAFVVSRLKILLRGP